MKAINKKQTKATLKEVFKVGDTLRLHYTTLGQNAIGFDRHTRIVKLTKINRVTAIAVDENRTYELDMDDLRNADIIIQNEVTRKNTLRD